MAMALMERFEGYHEWHISIDERDKTEGLYLGSKEWKSIFTVRRKL
jgi:hypothetical protein